MRWTTDKIRESFLDFFKERGHAIVPSASLIPKGDPTLLFTNAGMVPFKDYFLGLRTPTARRVADCQKCLRISGKHNDLEAVGRDSYHHTFFEMLGNWSFGDYYKAEAIAFHWELITRVWEIPPERLWATVYKDDDEAEQAWIKLKVLPKERILRCGEKDNFWEMGEIGPCGPCSEIHFDREPSRSHPTDEPGQACDQHAHRGEKCAVNVDGCSRFIELGNLVFIQYNRDTAGKLTPLPMKHVDTGTGLERVTAVMQGLETGRLLGNYDIDVFQKIIGSLQEIVLSIGNRVRYGSGDFESDVSYRAIADHSRAIAFLIAEGLRPDKNGPEYVLRRLIRRSIWHGYRLGIRGDFLEKICESVTNAMGQAYPELSSNQDRIRDTVLSEQRQFSATIELGLELVKKYFANPPVGSAFSVGGRTLPGDVAFRLHDTHGFPVDLTQAVCKDYGATLDVEGFNRLMEEQRERGRVARGARGSMAFSEEQMKAEARKMIGQASRFVGYDKYEFDSEVIAAPCDPNGECSVVVAETPFYPEGGGQVGDRGVIEAESGALVEVVNTVRHGPAILHVGKILRGEPGEFERGGRVKLQVDRERREAARLNHSATHILHYALREILGNSVRQAGSLVAPERLRFDFSHQGAIADADLWTIEEEINARIRENAEVAVEEMAYDDALKTGALAFFGDKYGDHVRVVRMGDFSVELCGGTHVQRTGDIGLFKLESEAGIAAGVRRVEAFTGLGALEAIRRREKILGDIGDHLGARDAQALERLERLLAREKELEKKLRALEQKLVSGEAAADADVEKVREANGVKIVTRKVAGVDAKALREMADRMRQKHGSAVVAIGSDLGDNKVALLIAVTADLTKKIKAGDIIKEIAPIIGGTGGGRPELAQAGGHDPGKLDEALDRVAALV